MKTPPLAVKWADVPKEQKIEEILERIKKHLDECDDYSATFSYPVNSFPGPDGWATTVCGKSMTITISCVKS